MVATTIWSVLAVGVFLWNHFRPQDYLGVRFTHDVFGFPVSGGWLCMAVALYCLVRTFVRRARARRTA